MIAHAILEKEAYEKVLTDHLLSKGILREFNEKLISSRKLIDNAMFFETFFYICKKWLELFFDRDYI